MPSALVLLNVEAGSEETVLEQLRKTSSVEEAYSSYGVYDLIIKIKADTLEELKDTLTLKIRAIDLVRATLTLMVAEE